MQISPAGTAKPITRAKQAGFTLVEVLMSMLIIGLMTGLVVLNLPPEPDPLEKQAKLFVSRLQTASQTSMIANQSIGIRITKTGYKAVRFVGGEWQTIDTFDFDLAQPPEFTLVRNGEKIDLKKARESEVPVIRYDATGLATPFELSMDVYGMEFRIEGAADGSVQMVDGRDGS